jgi:hypothetical protein
MYDVEGVVPFPESRERRGDIVLTQIDVGVLGKQIRSDVDTVKIEIYLGIDGLEISEPGALDGE